MSLKPNKTTRRRRQTRENTGSRGQAQKSKTFSKHQSNKPTEKSLDVGPFGYSTKEKLYGRRISPCVLATFLRSTYGRRDRKQHMSSRCTGAAVWVSLIILSCPIIDAQGLDRSGRGAICRGPIEGEIRGAGGRLFGGQSGDAPSEILSLLQGQPEGNQRRF